MNTPNSGSDTVNSKYITIIPLLLPLAGCSDQPAEQAALGTADTLVPKQQSLAVQTTADPHAGLDLTGSRSQGVGQAVPGGTVNPIITGQGRGTAITVEQAGGYTYVEVERGGQRIWLAGGRSDIKPGDWVRWKDGAVMRDFHSKALQRDFPALMFVTAILKDTGESAASTGRVLTVSHAAGYCYLEVETGKGRIWLAAPDKEINAGDSVRWNGGARMQNFYSKSLERDFETILFVNAVETI